LIANSESKATSLPLNVLVNPLVNVLVNLLALDLYMADFITDYSETPDVTSSGEALPQSPLRRTGSGVVRLAVGNHDPPTSR
jgi:hypothetical protein